MAPHIPASIDGKLLGLYLSDHLTGATAGVSRIQRMAEAFADTPVSAELSGSARKSPGNGTCSSAKSTTWGSGSARTGRPRPGWPSTPGGSSSTAASSAGPR